MAASALSGRGYSLKVTPEFKHISMGGAIQGFGVESTSMEHGFLHSTARTYRVVLLNEEATVLTVDREHEIFNVIPGSFNTVGLVVAVQVELLLLDGHWMDIEYRLALDRAAILRTMHSLYSLRGDDRVDSVECLRIDGADNVFLIAIGTVVAAPSAAVFSMDRWWHHFYHFHLFHDVVGGDGTALLIERESIELKQFLFRHDRGAFWVIHDDPAMWFLRHFGFMRFLFGHMLAAEDLYRFRSRSLGEIEREFEFVVRDYIVPFERAEPFLGDVIDGHFGSSTILWICPVVVDEALFLNIGVYLTLYDEHCAEWTDCVSMYQSLESETARSGGWNWFYAPSFLEREQFEALYLENGRFDYAALKRVRRKYGIQTVDFYDKIATIGARPDLRRIRRSRPRFKYLSHFPVAIKYVAWWIGDRFQTVLAAK